MEYENKNRNESVFSRKIRAGRRRTYFFDVKTTKGNDFYLTITESKKRHDGNGYERHKIFLYKEDFNKFLSETEEVINYIKSRMPDFDFDAFNHVYENNVDGTAEHQESLDQNDQTETNEVEEEHKEETNKPDDINSLQIDDDDLKM